MKKLIFTLILCILIQSCASIFKIDPQALAGQQKIYQEGDAKAQYNLGVMYEYGQGVPKHYKKAVDWYRKAAEQGLAAAQYNLGLMYEYDQGVPNDYKKAVNLYTKAAEQGLAKAQSNLGIMYQCGLGVPKDYKQAYAWLNIAAAKGVKRAIKGRDIVAKTLSQQKLNDAQALSAEIQKRINDL